MKIDLSHLITAETKQAAIAAEQAAVAQGTARSYLAETDWYITRKLETGKDIPEEISAARASARRILS